jgi:N-glycosylase/DNA lyase
VAEGGINLAAMSSAGDDTLREALCALPGVGEKVANCVMLFGYHRLSAFPRDVWINRIIDKEYGGSFPLHLYAPHAGVVQQYMFCYGRSPAYRIMQDNKESAV